MSDYVIGIGGSGARCVEALVHLLAAGALPARDAQGNTLFVGLVDPDVANGSVARSQQLIQLYNDTRAVMGAHRDFFRTELTRPSEPVWSIIRDGSEGVSAENVDLESSLEKQRLLTDSNPGSKAAALLMNALYTREERTVALSKGFRGRPAIGAAVLAKTELPGNSRFWRDLFEQLRVRGASRQTRPQHILLMGSVFGGTGAAGVPTLARMIRDQCEAEGLAVRVGAIVMLPYFTFGTMKQGEMAAAAIEFDANTKAALEFYSSKDMLEVIDDVYFLGESYRDAIESAGQALGGPDQRNPPHVVELCAALGAVDFFSVMRPKSHPVRLAARRGPGEIGWDDLPYPAHSELRARLTRLARFAVALNHLFVPALKDIHGNAPARRAPWFIDLFIKRGRTYSERDAERLRNLCGYTFLLLEWLGGISRQFEGVSTRLFDFDRLPQPVREQSFPLEDSQFLDTLVMELKRNESLAMGKVWDRVCARAARRPGPDTLGTLMLAILDACSVGR